MSIVSLQSWGSFKSQKSPSYHLNKSLSCYCHSLLLLFFFNGRISVQLWSSLVVNSLNSLQEVCWEEGTILGWGGGLSLDLGNKGAVAKLWDFLYEMDTNAVTWPGQCICGRYSDISVMRMIQSDAEQTRVLTWSRHLLFSSLVLHHANEES